MASLYVRNLVRSWIKLGAVPFYDTVNVEEDPQLDMWSTIDWGFSFPNKLTFCGDIQDEGSFQVVFFGQPGIGDQALLQAAETDMDLLLKQKDPTGKLMLNHYNPGEDFRYKNYYGVSFLVDYECTRS